MCPRGLPLGCAYLAVPLLLATPSTAVPRGSSYPPRFFGTTVRVTIENLLQMPENYYGRMVSTRATLDVVESTGAERFCLRGTYGGRVLLAAESSAEGDFKDQFARWVGHEVDVTGLFNMTQRPDPSSGQQEYFIAVSGLFGRPAEAVLDSAAEEDARSSPLSTGLITMEELITTVEAHRGRDVRVRGEFDGRNLSGRAMCDGPPRDGWVLQDGAFFVWISGLRPRSKGWSRPARSASCRLPPTDQAGPPGSRPHFFISSATAASIC